MTDSTPPDTPDIEQVTQEIAKRLNETLDGPVQQIRLIVTHMGAEFAREMLRETLAVQATGGMLTADQSRRRTPGGVFFYLSKGKMPADKRAIVFPLPHQARRVPTVPWEERIPLVQKVLEAVAEGQTGELNALPRLTLMGRPGAVVHAENTVAFEMRHELPPDLTFLRGTPQPPQLTLSFLVVAGRQQYERVEKALRKNQKERLLIEGICLLDPDLNVILVLPVIITTRSAQKRAREDQRQPMLTSSEPESTIVLPAHPVAHPTPERERQQQRELYRRIKEKEQARAARKAAQAAAQPEDAAKAAPAPQPQAVGTKPSKASKAAAPAPKAAAPAPKAAAPAPKPTPAPLSEAVQAQIRELELAANTLRERISAMEAKKQPGVAMTKKILENTERQIEALRRDASLQ
jgi:chemotaxis protein histidine kinase CheA